MLERSVGQRRRRASLIALVAIFASSFAIELLPMAEAILIGGVLIQVATLIVFAVYLRRLDRLEAANHIAFMAGGGK